MSLSRRRFLSLPFGTLLPTQLPEMLRLPVDRLQQTRIHLRKIVADRYIALDMRALDREHREVFRIQFNARKLLPVASCFKAFIAPWYYLNTPQRDWDDAPDSPVWLATVHSNNYFTSVALDQVASRIRGEGNAIEKFNDFLLSIGLNNGIYTWRMGPTLNLRDNRFQPSHESGRTVQIGDQDLLILNAFTATDLARGHDFLLRGVETAPEPGVARSLQRARELLGRPERYVLSPIERAYPQGYVGKQGVILGRDIATGHVLNDAGVIDTGSLRYVIAFMSVAEKESDAMSVLREIVRQAVILDRELTRARMPIAAMPRVRG